MHGSFRTGSRLGTRQRPAPSTRPDPATNRPMEIRLTRFLSICRVIEPRPSRKPQPMHKSSLLHGSRICKTCRNQTNKTTNSSEGRQQEYHINRCVSVQCSVLVDHPRHGDSKVDCNDRHDTKMLRNLMWTESRNPQRMMSDWLGAISSSSHHSCKCKRPNRHQAWMIQTDCKVSESYKGDRSSATQQQTHSMSANCSLRKRSLITLQNAHPSL